MDSPSSGESAVMVVAPLFRRCCLRSGNLGVGVDDWVASHWHDFVANGWIVKSKGNGLTGFGGFDVDCLGAICGGE